MSPGEVLREAWQLYRREYRRLLPIAFVVYLLLALFVLALALLLGWLGLLAGAVVSLAGVFWLQGALVVAVEDVRDGTTDLSIRETLSRVRPRMNTIGVTGILAALGIALGLVLLIVPGLVLATWWALIIPVIVLEGKNVTGAFGRSRELVRGNGWNVFGLIVLTFVILLATNIVITIVLSPLSDSVQGYVTDVVSNTLTAPFVACAFTLAYYRLRGAIEPLPAEPIPATPAA